MIEKPKFVLPTSLKSFIPLGLVMGMLLAQISAIGGEKKVLIRSSPSGARVTLFRGDVRGGLICKAVSREGSDDITPCTFAFEASAFDPSGRYWERSQTLGVSIKINACKAGYLDSEDLYLTKKEATVWKGGDVMGKIEKHFFFLLDKHFEVPLLPNSAYLKVADDIFKISGKRLSDMNEAETVDACREYYELNRPATAIQACSAALCLTGNNPDAYRYRCMSNYLLHNLQDALTDCQKQVALQPNNDSGWNNTGLILQGLGRQEDAVADFTKALQLNAVNAKALRNRALTYERLNRIQDSINDCDAALRLQPNDREMINLRAQLNARLMQR